MLLLFLVCPLSARAQPDCMSHWPQHSINFSGEVNGHEIQGFFQPGYPAPSLDGISGVFFFPREWTPLQLKTDTIFSVVGRVSDDCEMRLKDVNGGVWQLRFAPNDKDKLTGTFVDPSGTSINITLRLVDHQDCDGKGPWQEFNSPDWPITFTYPKRWKVATKDGRLAIACPSAEALASGGYAIVLSQGKGREPLVSDDGQRGVQVGSFATFEKGKWLVGVCYDPSPGNTLCSPARMSTWRGMTVLQGTGGEDRRYRAGDGGYVGNGGGGNVSYAFIFDDRWVNIDSDWGSLPLKQQLSSGPVIFEGDGVTARLVRSIHLKK